MATETAFVRWLESLPSEACNNNDIPMAESLAKRRRALLETGDYSDLIMVCEGREIKCHRTVLAEYSCVFNTMFKLGFSEGQLGNPVEIRSVSFKTLQKMLQFLYGGSVEFEAQEVMMVMEFGDMYDIDSLRRICRKMMSKHLTPKVAVAVWTYAQKYQEKEFISGCQQYCIENFADGIVTTNAFLALETEAIIKLLSDCRLKAPTENDVFSAILDWAMFDQEKRAVHLKEILEKCVRTDAMDVKSASLKIDPLKRSRMNDQVAAAMFNFMHDLTRNKFTDTRIRIAALLKPRINTDIRECLTIHIHNTNAINYIVKSGAWKDINNGESFEFFESKSVELVLGKMTRSFTTKNGRDLKYNEVTDGHRDWLPHLLEESAEHLLHLSISEEEGVVLRRFSNNGAWRCDYNYHTTDLQVSAIDIQLTALFANHLFMFVPLQNTVHVFETLHGHFVKSMTAASFGNDSTCVCVASKKNIACLVGDEFIYIIHLDRLLHQTPAADTDCEPPDAKRLKEEDGDQSATNARCDVMQSVKVPGVGDGGDLTAAVIYENNLCIAEKFVASNEQLVLYKTEMHDLLGNKLEEIHWRKHVIMLKGVSNEIVHRPSAEPPSGYEPEYYSPCVSDDRLRLFSSQRSNPFR